MLWHISKNCWVGRVLTRREENRVSSGWNPAGTVTQAMKSDKTPTEDEEFHSKALGRISCDARVILLPSATSRLPPPWFAPNPSLPNPIFAPPSMPAAACGRRFSHRQAGEAGRHRQAAVRAVPRVGGAEVHHGERAKGRCLLNQAAVRRAPATRCHLGPRQEIHGHRLLLSRDSLSQSKDFGPDPVAVVVQSTPQQEQSTNMW